MAVANPWTHGSWSEYKKEREEGRIRRLSWLQRVMRWDGLDGSEERQGEEEDEEEDVAEGGAEGERLERRRRSSVRQREGRGLEQDVQVKVDNGGGGDDGGDDSDSDGEVADEGDRKVVRKRRASDHLEKYVQAKIDQILGKCQKSETETPIQASDKEACGSHEHDCRRENAFESTEFERLSQRSDSISFSDYAECKRQVEEESENVDELGLDLAMGGANEVEKQKMDDLLLEVQLENKSSNKDLNQNVQSKQNSKKQFEQHLEFGSPGQSSACGISEMGKSYYEESYNEDREESEYLDLSKVEYLTEYGAAEMEDVEESAGETKNEFSGKNSACSISENGELDCGRSYCQDTEKGKYLEVNRSENVEEPATKPKYESEFYFSGQNSASGICENGELDYEEAYNLEREESEDKEVSRYEHLTEDGGAETSSQDLEETGSKPKEDSEFNYSHKNSTSCISENDELYYEDFYDQDTEDNKDSERSRFENLTEDGSENEGDDFEEFCHEDTGKVKESEVTRLENSSEDVDVETSTQAKVSEPPDEHFTEEEATTTDEDDDILADEDTDNYDLNEAKTYRHDNHTNEIFQTLKGFRDSQTLTDLEVKTWDGKSVHVHAVVLSAVSSLARRHLSKHHTWFWDRKVEAMQVGSEVEHDALEAVVEFAYTGAIQRLDARNAGEIKTAARCLAAPRVMEVCDLELSRNRGKVKPASTELSINLQKIEELWRNDMGCDVTLDVISASFLVHKVILAACSDYFRAMFTSGMKESSQSSIYLKYLSAPELESLLACSYTGSVRLSWNCVFEVTSTALQLQYQPALDLSLSFLQREINPHCCLDVASFAEAFGVVRLLDHAEDYVLRQFQKVSRTPKFKDLPATNLLKYLNSFALCVPSELVVFRAVVDWIQAKPKRRLKLAKDLMKTIHFPLMTFKEFKEVQALNMWSNHSLKELYEAIYEDFCSNEIETQNKCRIYLPKESLVLCGGDKISEDLGTRSISKDLWFGNSLRNHTGIKKAMEWRRLGEMPQPARFSHEVAVVRGQLYILGGKKYYGTGDTLNSFFRYNPATDAWEELPPMHRARSSFALVVLESQLFAIGGRSQPDYLDSVEQYCPTANTWRFARPLDLALGGHAARVFAGRILVSGGLNDDYDCLSSAFAYHPAKGSAHLRNMSRPRALHCMEALGERLYVAGGLSRTERGAIVDTLACEVYDPGADSWSALAPLPVPHVGAGSAVLEGKLYILGGYSQEDYSDTKMVHRYDPATCQWENMGRMPGPNNDLRACVLALPEHLRLCQD